MTTTSKVSIDSHEKFCLFVQRTVFVADYKMRNPIALINLKRGVRDVCRHIKSNIGRIRLTRA